MKQETPPPLPTGPDPEETPPASPYSDAITFAWLYQAVIGVLAALVLDGGQAFQYYIVAMVAFWGTCAVIFFRAKYHPTKLDLLWIKWGFIPVLMATPQLMNLVWKWRGVRW